jgi:hypothetical protein
MSAQVRCRHLTEYALALNTWALRPLFVKEGYRTNLKP